MFVVRVNIHRSPYAGRAFEYFSEDGFLSGVMAGHWSRGCQSKGVYVEKFTVTQCTRFERIFNEIYNCFHQNDELSVLGMKANVLLLIQAILTEFVSDSDGAHRNEIVSNFINYATNHFREDINITELAKQYGFSPNYFSKLFKTIINKTPKEYLINVRLDEAKKLLKLGLYTVSEVCTMVGYDDLHYFSRLFKQKEGISPALFAKQVCD